MIGARTLAEGLDRVELAAMIEHEARGADALQAVQYLTLKT